MEAVKKVQQRFGLIFHTAQNEAEGCADAYYPQNVHTVYSARCWRLIICGDQWFSDDTAR